MNTITIIGSINLDRTLRVEKMPRAGETIQTLETFSSGGGKGANQAVAAKRSGAETFFVGAVGDDTEGKMMTDLLLEEGIDVNGVFRLKNHETGQAFILVDSQGENSIIIHSGANMELSTEQLQSNFSTIAKSDFVIAQCESDLERTNEAFEYAKGLGIRTILNPAPARKSVSESLLKATDVIIPNETETEILTGIKITDKPSMVAAAAKFHELGIRIVIITLGARGAFYDDGLQQGIVPAHKVKANDTTAAGDTFIGALSSKLKTDFSNLEEAIQYGNQASAIAVQRYGAQPSIPYQSEINIAKQLS